VARGLLIVVALYAMGLLAGRHSMVRRWELAAIDARYLAFPDKFKAGSSQIVIVDIDDESDRNVRAVWPWPRSYYARLITNLRRAGARAIVIDVLLDRPRTDFASGDDSLAAVLAQPGIVVLGGKTWYANENRPGLQITLDTGGASLVLPAAAFLNADSSNWGLTDVKTEADGVVRDYYTMRALQAGARPYPTLAVRACAAITGKAPDTTAATFTIAYPGGAKTFSYYSFYQVIDDSSFRTKDEDEWESDANWFDSLAAGRRFEGKIVLVGSSMAEAHDVLLTPFSAGDGFSVPGVEVHAAALHTLLNGYHIRTVGWWAVAIALFVVCGVIFVLGMTTRVWVYVPAVAVIALGWVLAAALLYGNLSLLVPVAMPITCIILVAAGQQAYLFYLEQQRRREVTGMFGRYVPRAVVRELIRDPSKMRLGGERRELTVLFCDVKDFTPLCESLEPERVVELLNEYLTAMADIVIAQGGIIDKYEGDLIMAEFGIPLEQPDHAVRACRAVFLMQARLAALHTKWRAEGKPLLYNRVGIGSGVMLFGNMGSQQMFDYTVIGDVANLASRLEGANKGYGTNVMLNERAAELVRSEMLVRELDLLRVKGKQRPEKCFQLMAPASAPDAEETRGVIRLFGEGLQLYRSQRWDDALGKFQEVLAVRSDDAPAKVFVERCRQFKLSPPGEQWDGVFEMKSK
jgi:adenylate cyclase